jgi:hypothetical protein
MTVAAITKSQDTTTTRYEPTKAHAGLAIGSGRADDLARVERVGPKADRRVAHWAAIAMVLIATASSASATLVRSDNEVSVFLSSRGAACAPALDCEVHDDDPLLATGQLGESFASGDVTLGLVRSRAVSRADADGRSAQSGGGSTLDFGITNRGTAPLSLGAGAISLSVRASFQRMSAGLLTTAVSAELSYASNPGNYAFTGARYQVLDSPSTLGPVVVQFEASQGAGVDPAVVTRDTLDIRLYSGPITVLPGEELSLRVWFATSTGANGIGGLALVDASLGAALSLMLPAGTAYNGDGLNVAWISVVPEPASAVLLGIGLLGVTWVRRRQALSASALHPSHR